MLVFLKTAQTADHTIYPFLAYADTLITWTHAGLSVMGNEKKYEKQFAEADKLYMSALHTLQQSDFAHAGWKQEQVISLTYKINRLIFPIAMMEGVIVLNQEMVNVSGMLLGSPDVSQEQ